MNLTTTTQLQITSGKTTHAALVGSVARHGGVQRKALFSLRSGVHRMLFCARVWSSEIEPFGAPN